MVFAGKFQIALIVRRATEDHAGAIGHQHKIGDVNRQLPICIEGMQSFDAGIEAELLRGFDGFLGGAAFMAIAHESGEFRIACRQALDQRVIGRERDEAGAEDRVRPGGKDLHL